MLFSNLYIHLFLIFIFYHGLCGGGCEAIDGMGVGSTSKFVPRNVISIMNNIVIDVASYHDLELTESQATPMGAYTLQCIDMEKGDVKVFSVTKSYTYSMDIMATSVYIMCNINIFDIML